MGIRRKRRKYRPELGPTPVVLYLGGRCGLFPLEDVLALAGIPIRVSLLPAHGSDPL
jgi:hypothetical protein